MFDPKKSTLSSRDAEHVFPWVDTVDIPENDFATHAVARILYCNRATKESPLQIQKINGAAFCENTVFVAFIEDWFECDILKKNGKIVPAAAALNRFKIEAKAFINEELKSGVIAVKRHAYFNPLLLTLLPQVTPWFFKDKPLTEWEKEFLMSLLKDEESVYDSKVSEFSAQINLESLIKKAKLEKFVGDLLQRKINTLVLQEKSIIEKMVSYEDEIRLLQAELTEVGQKIIGIKSTHEDDSVASFANAIATNKNCIVKNYSNAELDIVVMGHLVNFSKTAYESISRSYNSCFYSSCAYSSTVTKQLFHRMMDELLLGKKYRINLAGEFKIDFSKNNIRLLRTYGSVLHENAIPNPHIAHYACAGGFMAMYNEAFRSGDYLEVLDVAFSEVQNINWTDYSPVGAFMEDLCALYWGRPCVWNKEDKKYITPHDLADILRQEVEG